ncbi:transmembrane transporter [Schizosaccharomyces osmophilus]|uniref:Transmembrane transporter n=1 Tax=Schizosaccharomyces osmophilus TaxID=2545709 RepID=A0AAE9WEE8_9SCHI|nr:transmembrane transporter [Schizosaccharomyces osmophilus]WBW74827.1 transmembrane transporter [Schizosaccharomyces osmophilus]
MSDDLEASSHLFARSSVNDTSSQLSRLEEVELLEGALPSPYREEFLNEDALYLPPKPQYGQSYLAAGPYYANKMTPGWPLNYFIGIERSRFEKKLSNFWLRNFLLQVLAPCVVLLWCAIPMPLYQDNQGIVRIKFWFFLFFYYGIYNAVGLLWITKLFHIYSVNWFSSKLGGTMSYILFWAFSILVGSLAVYFTAWRQITFTWITLMFISMIIPIGISFSKLWNKHSRRTTQFLSQLSLLEPNVRSNAVLETIGWKDAYAHYSWFIIVLCVTLVVYLAGEYLTNIYMSTLPHSSSVAIAYVYSWMCTVSLCNLVSSWILNTKTHSYALVSVFKLYFELTLQVYVRNLYARLESPQQFVLVQIASSLTMMTVVPLILMSRTAYHFNKSLTNSLDPYAVYRKNMGRNFYVKCVASNLSMLSFLGWSVILHFGPNAAIYPYFTFAKDSPYSFKLTFYASSAVWASELIAAYFTRLIMSKYYDFEVSLEAIRDFVEYPDMIPAFIFVGIHVLQNVLFSIIQLRF